MGNDVFERNVEALLRAGAPPKPQAAPARVAFLRRIEAPAPRPGLRPALAAAGILAAVLAALALRPAPGVPRPPAAPEEPVAVPVPARRDGIPAPRLPEAPPAPPRAAAAVRVGRESVSLAASRPPSGRILRLEGRAELPDQAVLTLRLFAAQETLREGRLEKSWRAAWTGQVTVKDRAFSVAPPAPEPGEVRVETSFRDEAQRRAVLKDLEGKIEVRQWDSVLPGWDDAHAAGLPARFAELEAAAGDSVRWLDGVAAAVSSEEEWKSRSAALSREGEGLLLRLQAASAFPASRTELERSVRTALIAGRHFAWKDGSFLGPVSYYPPLHSGEFSLAALRRAAEGAREVAGRELALWALKEARRGGAPSKLVAPHAAKPGFAPYAARLDAASGFDALEADIRAGR